MAITDAKVVTTTKDDIFVVPIEGNYIDLTLIHDGSAICTRLDFEDVDTLIEVLTELRND